jgi:anaerobic ribonucleoside-triphosphate reductase
MIHHLIASALGEVIMRPTVIELEGKVCKWCGKKVGVTKSGEITKHVHLPFGVEPSVCHSCGWSGGLSGSRCPECGSLDVWVHHKPLPVSQKQGKGQ